MGFTLGRTLCALTWGSLARTVTSETLAYTLAGKYDDDVGGYPNGMPAPCESPLANASACSVAASELGLTYGGETPTCVNATISLWREETTDYSYTGTFELYTYITSTDLKGDEVFSATLAANNEAAVTIATAEVFTVCLTPGAYAGCAYVADGSTNSAAFNWEMGSPNKEVAGEAAGTAKDQTSCGDQGSFTVSLTTGCYRQDDYLFFRDTLPYGESCGTVDYCMCESVDSTRYELQLSGTCPTAISTANGYNATDCARAFGLIIEGGIVEREGVYGDDEVEWPCEDTDEGCGPVWVVVDSGSPTGCFYEADSDSGTVYFNNDNTSTVECSGNQPCVCQPVPDPTSYPTWSPSTSPTVSPTLTYAPTPLVPPTPQPTTDDTTFVAGSFDVAFVSYSFPPDATDFANIKEMLETQLGLDAVDSDGQLTAFNITSSANRRRLLGLGSSSSSSSSDGKTNSTIGSAGSAWRSLSSSGVTWSVTFTLQEGFRQVSGGTSAADLLTSVTSVLSSTAFFNALTLEVNPNGHNAFSVTNVVAGVVTPFPTGQPTLEPSLMPTVVPSAGGAGTVSSAASSSVLLIVVALVGGICFASGVGLCLAKRRSDSKHRAEYEDALANAEGNIGLTIVRTGPAARAKAPRGSNGASVNVYVIPFENLKLEARPFAQGGGGMVFRGTYSGNKVAAKQVFSNVTAEDRDEFDREVSMLAKLMHPCIMNLYGISQDHEGSLYMVMEFCGGGDLAGYYTETDFNNQEYMRVCKEMLSALAYLHERGIAHRDVKPENVLLETATKRVKLADFGLAKKNRNTVTRGVGTPSYMPPEMFDDDEDPEKTNMLAVDVYALSIILWQLWFKRLPFEGKSIHKIISWVGKGKRLKLDAEHHPSPPEPLKTLIQDCWAQLSTDRPHMQKAFEDFETHVMPSIEGLPPTQNIGGDVSSANLSANLLQQASFFVSPEATTQAVRKSISFFNVDNLVGGGATTTTTESSDAATKAKANAGYGIGPNDNKTSKSSSSGGRFRVGDGAIVGSLTTTSMSTFLASANLDQYAPKLAALGYTDVEDLSDRHILDDNTLVAEVGMTKDDVRALRAKIAKEGTNPTMMKAKRDQGKNGKKPPAALTIDEEDDDDDEGSGATLGARQGNSKIDDQAAKDAAAKGSVSGFGAGATKCTRAQEDQAAKDAAAKRSVSAFGLQQEHDQAQKGAAAKGAGKSTREQEDQAAKDAAAKGSFSSSGSDGADAFTDVGDITLDVGVQGMQTLRHASGTITQSFAFMPGFGGGDDGDGKEEAEGATDLDALAEEGEAPATAQEGGQPAQKRGTLI